MCNGFLETENENLTRPFWWPWDDHEEKRLHRKYPDLDMKWAPQPECSLGIHVLCISVFVVSRNYQFSPDPPNLWFQDLDIVVHFSVFASYLRGFPVSTGKWHVGFWWCNLGLLEWVPEMGHIYLVQSRGILLYPRSRWCPGFTNIGIRIWLILSRIGSGIGQYKIVCKKNKLVFVCYLRGFSMCTRKVLTQIWARKCSYLF